MKKIHDTHFADLPTFDYTITVVASDPSGANPIQYSPQNMGHCREQYLMKPNECYGDDVIHCVHT